MNKTLTEANSRSDRVKGRVSEPEDSNRNYLKWNTIRRENKKLNRASVCCGTDYMASHTCNWNPQRRGEKAEAFDQLMAETFPGLKKDICLYFKDH